MRISTSRTTAHSSRPPFPARPAASTFSITMPASQPSPNPPARPQNQSEPPAKNRTARSWRQHHRPASLPTQRVCHTRGIDCGDHPCPRRSAIHQQGALLVVLPPSHPFIVPVPHLLPTESVHTCPLSAHPYLHAGSAHNPERLRSPCRLLPPIFLQCDWRWRHRHRCATPRRSLDVAWDAASLTIPPISPGLHPYTGPPPPAPAADQNCARGALRDGRPMERQGGFGISARFEFTRRCTPPPHSSCPRPSPQRGPRGRCWRGGERGWLQTGG